MARKGMGYGTGKGYKNIAGSDPRIHSQSAKGIKQQQRISQFGSGIVLTQTSAKKREDDMARKTLSQLPERIKKEYGLEYLEKELKNERYEPNALPIYKIGGFFYFRDVRLGEYRNVADPSDRKRIDDVPNSELQKWTKRDSEFIFGKEQLSPEDIKGLSSWVSDYKKAIHYQNIKLAKQIRDNIVKVLKEKGVEEPYKHEIWGKSNEWEDHPDYNKDQLKGGLYSDDINFGTKNYDNEESIKDTERELDYLKGGLGDNKPDSAFDKKELAKGIKVEMEHTNNPEIAKEVVKDHLTEFKGKSYYKELDKMEKKLKKENSNWLNLAKKDIKKTYGLRKAKNELGESGYEVYFTRGGHVPEMAMGEKNWFRNKRDAISYRDSDVDEIAKDLKEGKLLPFEKRRW